MPRTKIVHELFIARISLKGWFVQQLIEDAGALVDQYVDLQRPYLAVLEYGDLHNKPHVHIAGTRLLTHSTFGNRVSDMGYTNANKYVERGKPEKMEEHFMYLCKGTGTGKEDGPNVIRKHISFTVQVITTLNKAANLIKYRSAGKRKRSEETPSKEILRLAQQEGVKTHEIDRIYDVVWHYYRKKVKYLNPTYFRNLVFQTSLYLDEGEPGSVRRTNSQLRAYATDHAGWCAGSRY